MSEHHLKNRKWFNPSTNHLYRGYARDQFGYPRPELKELRFTIIYVLTDFDGLQPGYCILGLDMP